MHGQQSPRILIFGGWFGSQNAGDEAILVALRDLFHEKLPGCTILAHTIDPAYTSSVCRVEPVFPPTGRSKLTKALALAQAYRTADLFVISGGTPIFDYYYLSRMFHFGVPTFSRIPIVFLGVGIKPIRSWYGKLFYKFFLDRAAYVSARDPEVIAHMRQLGVTRSIALTADSAVCLRTERDTEARQLLVRAGLDPERPIVAICPVYLSDNYRDHYHQPVPPARRQHAYQCLARTADRILDRGQQVLLFPMHQVAPDDDREIIARIRAEMRNSPAEIHPPAEPDLVAAILARMHMVVGMRLHSLVLASAQHVPVVAIGFDMKVGGFMRYLNLAEYCQDIHDLDLDTLLARVDQCSQRHDEIRNHLVDVMTRWRAEVRSSIEDVTARISQPH